MMRVFLIVLLYIFQLTTSCGQPSDNSILKHELDSLQMLDQKYRAALWKLQGEIDSLNTCRIEQIIEEYGYPGVSLVGKPTNEAAFYIIQHSKVIDEYLPVIKEAAEKNELRFALYAMMLDRSLMFQEQEQVYGTQGSGMSVKNKKTGNWENLSFIWPIIDPATVNQRRKAAGFDQTIEESAKSIGINYKVYTLGEILKFRKEIVNAGAN